MMKPWKNLSRKDKFAFTLNAILLIGIGQALRVSIVAHEPTMVTPPAQPQKIEAAAVDPAIEAMLDSGECWNGKAPKDASGNVILPTRVIYAGEVRGSKMVDKTLQAIFNDADNGINPKLVSAYCK